MSAATETLPPNLGPRPSRLAAALGGSAILHALLLLAIAFDVAGIGGGFGLGVGPGFGIGAGGGVGLGEKRQRQIFSIEDLPELVRPDDDEQLARLVEPEQRQAVEILTPFVAEHPEHPGVAHYLIHSLDYPPLAHLALDAARRYARIAPGSSHALHMPSHIFVRLGLWPESIASNLDSADAAIRSRALFADTASFDELHALDYLEYAYLQTGQDAAAAEAAERAARGGATDRPLTMAAAYALEHLGGTYHAYTWSEFAARYEQHFGKL